MTKKFTEEEYQKIVGIANHLLNNRSVIELSTLDEIYFQIQHSSTNEERNKFKDLNQELALIALPKSRDWAHDKFVEKEKKYYWRTKKKNNCGIWLNLNMNKYDSVEASYKRVTPLTESEIREWGYNPDMFDKEEVE